MRVAGFGLRADTGEGSLRAALALAGGAEDLGALAVVADKAHLPGIVALARTLDLPLRSVEIGALGSGITLSQRQPVRYGATSVAEGAALGAAGPGATLTVRRVVSPDGRATAAIAEGAP